MACWLWSIASALHTHLYEMPQLRRRVIYWWNYLVKLKWVGLNTSFFITLDGIGCVVCWKMGCSNQNTQPPHYGRCNLSTCIISIVVSGLQMEYHIQAVPFDIYSPCVDNQGYVVHRGCTCFNHKSQMKEQKIPSTIGNNLRSKS